MTERGEVWHGVGNGLDSGRGVVNGLYRGHLDVVVGGVDMPTRDVLAFKGRCQGGTPSVVSSNTVAAEREPAANNGNREMGQQGTCRTPGTMQ